MRRAAAVLLAVASTLAAPAAAGAFVVAGSAWPHGYVPYHVDAPSLRSAVEQAAARWNRSGADIHLTEVPVARASIRIRRLGRNLRERRRTRTCRLRPRAYRRGLPAGLVRTLGTDPDRGA